MAVAVLSDVPAYMIVTFFKTVFLAISIGLVHGILFLPLMLSLFVRGMCLHVKLSKIPLFPGFCTVGSRSHQPPTESISCNKIVPSFSFYPKPDTIPKLREDYDSRFTYLTPANNFIDGFEVPSPPSFPPPPLPDSNLNYSSSSLLTNLPPLPSKSRRH